jgi:hypothetical protein
MRFFSCRVLLGSAICALPATTQTSRDYPCHNKPFRNTSLTL